MNKTGFHPLYDPILEQRFLIEYGYEDASNSKICRNCINFYPFEWCKDTKKKGFCKFRKYSNGQVIVDGFSTCKYFNYKTTSS
jgi:hypothetical protein